MKMKVPICGAFAAFAGFGKAATMQAGVVSDPYIDIKLPTASAAEVGAAGTDAFEGADEI
jgi:hypothetical protein